MKVEDILPFSEVCGTMSEDMHDKEYHTLILARVTPMRQLPKALGVWRLRLGWGKWSKTRVQSRPSEFICMNNGWVECKGIISFPIERMSLSLI